MVDAINVMGTVKVMGMMDVTNSIDAMDAMSMMDAMKVVDGMIIQVRCKGNGSRQGEVALYRHVNMIHRGLV